jgi:ABC-type sugar transport system ATPase subunit
VKILFESIEKLKNKGVAIIYISHKMDEIFKVADSITILRDGKLIDTKPAADLNPQKLINLMVGREIAELFPNENIDKDIASPIEEDTWALVQKMSAEEKQAILDAYNAQAKVNANAWSNRRRLHREAFRNELLK